MGSSEAAMKALQMRRSSKPVNAGPLEVFKAASVMMGMVKKGNLRKERFSANRADLQLRKKFQMISSRPAI